MYDIHTLRDETNGVVWAHAHTAAGFDFLSMLYQAAGHMEQPDVEIVDGCIVFPLAKHDLFVTNATYEGLALCDGPFCEES